MLSRHQARCLYALKLPSKFLLVGIILANDGTTRTMISYQKSKIGEQMLGEDKSQRMSWHLI